MSVKILIPAPLRQFTNGTAVVESNGATVGDLINDLKAKGPGIETRLFKGQTGTLNRFVNIFVNQEDIRFLQNLDTPVKDGDEVSIVAAIAGG
jgi:sulfur-carrier protein